MLGEIFSAPFNKRAINNAKGSLEEMKEHQREKKSTTLPIEVNTVPEKLAQPKTIYHAETPLLGEDPLHSYTKKSPRKSW